MTIGPNRYRECLEVLRREAVRQSQLLKSMMSSEDDPAKLRDLRRSLLVEQAAADSYEYRLQQEKEG